MGRWIRYAALVLSCATFAGLSLAPRADAAAARLPLLAKVDHVYATSPDAERLFTVLHDSLGLPAAWPFKRYGTFASGAVWVGNVALEFVSSGTARGDRASTTWEGIAFEPVGHTDTTVAELGRRDIRYAKPDSFYLKDSAGALVRAWTNTDLTDLSPTGIAFICDYTDRARNHSARRAAQDSLLARNGGPLGIVAVTEIAVGVHTVASARSQWRRLVDRSSRESRGVVRFGDGPAVRLRSSSREGILEIVLAVRALPVARAALAERGLLEPGGAGDVLLSTRALRGLHLRLVGR